MIYLTIGPKYEAHQAKLKYNCDYVISLQDIEDQKNDVVPTPQGVKPENHIHLFFDDLSDEYPVRQSSRDPELIRRDGPSEEHVQKVLDFIKTIPDWSRVYIHCFAGVSRSTSMAFVMFCAQSDPGTEEGCMMLTERAALHRGIWPNSRIVRFGDQILKRDGAMIKAVAEWKAAEKALCGDVLDKIDKLKEESPTAAEELANSLVNKAVLWDRQQERLKIDNS